jgi:hypothetical protein
MVSLLSLTFLSLTRLEPGAVSSLPKRGGRWPRATPGTDATLPVTSWRSFVVWAELPVGEYVCVSCVCMVREWRPRCFQGTGRKGNERKRKKNLPVGERRPYEPGVGPTFVRQGEAAGIKIPLRSRWRGDRNRPLGVVEPYLSPHCPRASFFFFCARCVCNTLPDGSG